MPFTKNPEQKQRMELAKKILQELYSDFEQLVVTFEAKLDTPAWDIICFYIRTKLARTNKQFDD